MPKELSESVTGAEELIFPDDASGRQYRLRERLVYGAEEVRDQLGSDDVPRYGDWLPVETEQGDGWLNAPSSLRRELVETKVETGDRFTVEQMQKSGHRESDPYIAEISVDRARDGDQTGLSATGDD